MKLVLLSCFSAAVLGLKHVIQVENEGKEYNPFIIEKDFGLGVQSDAVTPICWNSSVIYSEPSSHGCQVILNQYPFTCGKPQYRRPSCRTRCSFKPCCPKSVRGDPNEAFSRPEIPGIGTGIKPDGRSSRKPSFASESGDNNNSRRSTPRDLIDFVGGVPRKPLLPKEAPARDDGVVVVIDRATRKPSI